MQHLNVAAAVIKGRLKRGVHSRVVKKRLNVAAAVIKGRERCPFKGC